MAVAFIITYVVASRFHNIKKTVSISLIMFLSALPDVDIIFRSIGIALGHRTFTHSLIITLLIGGLLIFLLGRNRKSGITLAIYVIAYLSHILIGDIVVGSINIVYPFGYLLMDSRINSWSLSHLIIESIVFIMMASIVVISYYLYKKDGRRKGVGSRIECANYDDGYSFFLFVYHRNLDGLFYPIIIVAIIVSLIYLSFDFDFILLWTENLLGIIVLVALHTIAIAIILLMWTTSRKASIRNISIHSR